MTATVSVAEGFVKASATVTSKQFLSFMFFAGLITSATCLVMLSQNPN